MTREHEVRGFINRYRHRDGHYRHLEWRARRVGDKVFGVARDVTERLALEAECVAANHAAQAANLAKSEFLANMSHEIRTPLNGVIGLVAVLSRTSLTPAQREMVELIKSSGVTLERLVSDLLDVSKIEAGRVEIEARPFDLRAELDGLLAVHRLRAEDKGLAFKIVHDDAAHGAFLGDATRIRQVLDNLLSNAIKFTPQGQISVRVAVMSADGADARLTLEVEDTGVGFDAAFGDNLFQRFGLSICKSLVEMMGGRITARSKLGQGSLFQVTLPLRPAPIASDGAGETIAIDDPRRGEDPALRVLLAEDHAINQRVVQLILEPYGAEVTTVADGAQAVAAFKAGAFDLVLMDMQMPVMDGLAATRAMRAHEAGRPERTRTPIAMLSANAMTQHRQDALAAGADVHIAKPVTAATLIAGVDEALASRD
jgi:signal transduction histidine kinase/CheY-like chemotaxis protein